MSSNKKSVIKQEISEEIFYEPKFNTDLKIVYDSTCFNVHNYVLTRHSKYFKNLLKNTVECKLIQFPTFKDAVDWEIS